MKFTRIIGKIDPKLLNRAEETLSQIFLELGTRYSNTHVGSFMGGDPLIFGLMYPVEHIATLNIPSVATDGKRYYWNPKYVLKHSKIGLRILCAHEAWHAIYLHPSRIGSRNIKLWNIAVDYIVNGTVMEDLKARKMNPEETFSKNLGRFMKLKDYAELIKNPNAVIKGFEDLKISEDLSDNSTVELPKANEDRELTPQEQKELERREKKVKFYYADPGLDEDMKLPEKIYDFLYKLLPKCSKCGSLGKYPSKSKRSSKEQKDQNDQQGSGKEKGCDQCGGGCDIFGLGGTVDDHMTTEESEEKLAKRISDAMESAKKMAGYVPASFEEELGKLTEPKVKWQDVIRTRLLKARAGNGRNDWTRFRVRPMFAGLLTPKKKNYFAHFGCLLDTSGSMSKDDMAFGLSQLQSLDERSEGTIVPADAQIYWDDATKLRQINKEEISKIKIIGRGGTKYAEFFDDYEKHIGKCDFLIVVTDGFLLDTDIAEMKNPGIDVIWLLTSSSAFNAPFGRVFDLHST